MAWLTSVFILAVAAGTALRLWLASRQIAAVQGHRDRVPEPFAEQISLADHRKAADYTTARMRLGRATVLLDAFVMLGLTIGGGIAGVDAAWQRTGWSQPWHGVAVIVTVVLLLSLMGLPFAIWRTFGLEARFGFNRTTPRLFATDLLKRLLLALLIGVPILLAVLVLMEGGGRWWWLYAWLVWLSFTLLLTWAWPRLIAPLFNRFTPLADATLRSRVETLVARCGFSANGVFVMDGSRRSAHGNAYFAGVGKTKRIVFFDTLLEKLCAAEIEAVLAHELGHFRLRHVHQGLLVSSVTALIGLAVLAWLARDPGFYTALGVPEPSTHAAVLLFMLALPAFTYFLSPVRAWWSRRHELQADDFAARFSDARALATALTKLYRDNATTLTPDRVHSAFYDSHPPALVRITRLSARSSSVGSRGLV